MDDDTASIYDLELPLAEIVRYFDEIENKLTEQSGFPVKLQQHRAAWHALMIVSELIEDDRERRRTRKHWEPDDVAEKFIRHVMRFLTEQKLTPQQLAEHMAMPVDSILQLYDAELLTCEEWRDD
jgi:hypothetical protein